MNNVFEKLKSFSTLGKLRARRQKQLEDQAKVDNNISLCNSFFVSRYLLRLRAHNRSAMKVASKVAFYQLPRLYERDMDVIDEYQKPLLEGDQETICKNLKELSKTVHLFVVDGEDQEIEVK